MGYVEEKNGVGFVGKWCFLLVSWCIGWVLSGGRAGERRWMTRELLDEEGCSGQGSEVDDVDGSGGDSRTLEEEDKSGDDEDDEDGLMRIDSVHVEDSDCLLLRSASSSSGNGSSGTAGERGGGRSAKKGSGSPRGSRGKKSSTMGPTEAQNLCKLRDLVRESGILLLAVGQLAPSKNLGTRRAALDLLSRACGARRASLGMRENQNLVASKNVVPLLSSILSSSIDSQDWITASKVVKCIACLVQSEFPHLAPHSTPVLPATSHSMGCVACVVCTRFKRDCAVWRCEYCFSFCFISVKLVFCTCTWLTCVHVDSHLVACIVISLLIFFCLLFLHTSQSGRKSPRGYECQVCVCRNRSLHPGSDCLPSKHQIARVGITVPASHSVPLRLHPELFLPVALWGGEGVTAHSLVYVVHPQGLFKRPASCWNVEVFQTWCVCAEAPWRRRSFDRRLVWPFPTHCPLKAPLGRRCEIGSARTKDFAPAC